MLPDYPIHGAVSHHPANLADQPTAADAAPDGSGRLRHLGVLRFAGADAGAFLQGQVSNDTRRLSEGKPLLAAFSSAQGRVLAVLQLLPHSSGILALLPRDIATATAERLRKFVLRAKVKIEDLSEEFAVVGVHPGEGLLPAEFDAPGDGYAYTEKNGIGVGRVTSAEGFERYWMVGPAALLQHASLSGFDPESVERAWRLADIRSGVPQVYAATSEAFVAQMLNLDLLDGISFTKGCYTGQEIIARTQHLGRIKRRMFRLRLPEGEWSIGQSVRLADGRAGRLTEIARAGDHDEALAVLTLEPAAPDGVETIDAIELPLPYRHEALKDQ